MFRRFALASSLAFLLGFASGLLHAETDRFDHKVRAGFFAGFAGNAESLQSSMRVCEEILAGNPRHAEALVWHGSGLYFRAGQLMRTSPQEGQMLFIRAIQEMDRAVELAPDDLGVRIPRGAVLLTGTRFMPPGPMTDGLIRTALGDYQRALDAQEGALDRLSDHQRGELLFGLAEGYHRMGDREKAAGYFNRLLRLMPDTEYGRRAALWRETGSVPRERTGCVGCHVAPAK